MKSSPQSFNGLGLGARLHALGDGLTAAERRVGDYFQGKPEAAYLSITEVVSDSGLGYGTVMRFCQKLGCSGFQDFKVLLARELARVEAENGDGEKDPVARYTQRVRAELADTAKLNDRQTVRKVAAALNAAGRVLVGGIAGSAAPAVGFDYRLSRVGIVSNAICDGYNLGIRAAMLGRGDVFVAISFSGATKDMLQAAHVARANGATTVSLTNFVHAPLVELVDHSLFSATGRDPLSCEIFSVVTTHFVLDLVFSELCRIRDGAREAIDKTFRAISDRRV